MTHDAWASCYSTHPTGLRHSAHPSLLRAVGVEGFLVVTHDLVPFDVVAAGRGVGNIGNGKELMRDAEFGQVGGVFLIEFVVEAFRTVPDEDAQRRTIRSRGVHLGEVPGVVTQR